MWEARTGASPWWMVNLEGLRLVISLVFPLHLVATLCWLQALTGANIQRYSGFT